MAPFAAVAYRQAISYMSGRRDDLRTVHDKGWGCFKT
jgi:hypothetical protein